ncbi:transglutaminase-like domain-containing protein [Kingella potus]|uniref:transglutaminase-like domain-containing protein n=1 Tax=Kingella potus TaxID=265175 RepID=UPI001FD2A4A9|nr:transglutaminase-like domain-containing protein [Kingella potus]UOP00496.1 transglutaminase-like domain-containing protein [Kingella potus]
MILRDQNGMIPALDHPLLGREGGMKIQLGNVVRVRSREGLRRVQLQARASDHLPQKLKQFEKQIYLRLPASGNARTRQLAQMLAQQSTSARDFAQKVLNYYRSQHFAYTLQPPIYSGSRGDSIDTFMFDGKQGFCEHYAESFVVMMRAVGVPARVVTGYLGADYQESGNFWQIRSKNAHAWAEIWLENEQTWLRIDPTAAVSEQRLSGGLDNALPEQEREMIAGSDSSVKIWNKWLESGQFYWQQWVVNYDESSQNSLFGKLGLSRFSAGTALLAALVGISAALIPVVWWWKRGTAVKNKSRSRKASYCSNRCLLPKQTTPSLPLPPPNFCNG